MRYEPFDRQVEQRTRSTKVVEGETAKLRYEGEVEMSQPNQMGGNLVILPIGEVGKGARITSKNGVFPLRPGTSPRIQVMENSSFPGLCQEASIWQS